MPRATTPKQPPLLERWGTGVLAARARNRPRPANDDAVHFLNPDELRNLRRVQRGAALRAFGAGAVAATVSAAAEAWAAPMLVEGAPLFSDSSLRFWLTVGAVTLLASVVEILFLYWDTLRSVHELAHVAGLHLDDAAGDEALLGSLARAALELPNPVQLDVGVDPHREVSKWQLLAASMAYKAKVGLTSFVLKLLVRRVLGRTLLRSIMGALVPFVAVPVTALWNAVVSWRTLDEARLRAMGPSAVDEQVGRLEAELRQLSEPARHLAMQAVAAAIVRTRDLHPNLVRLLTQLRHSLAHEPEGPLDDINHFLSALPRLSAPEQGVVLQLLGLACVLDGRLTHRERKLWRHACRALRPDASAPELEPARRAFVRGDGQLSPLLAAFNGGTTSAV